MQQKREVESKEGDYARGAAVPAANDIFDGPVLTLILKCPMSHKNSVDVEVENDVLSIEGRVDFSEQNGFGSRCTPSVGH